MQDPKDDERQGYSGENTDLDTEKAINSGPASGRILLDDLGHDSNLYVQKEALRREGNLGHKEEDLSTNSDGTNPGTEYSIPPDDVDCN